jgi:flavin reductase (DIM6/NTAB) family NADH-FMN oxidoreductase RutF/rubredoxin
MINFEAQFKISYGLYIVSSGDNTKGNGFISNTVFQVTAVPARFACCCHKNNFTTDLIIQSGAFSVSILHKETPLETIGRFGYKSGKDIDKLEGMQLKYGETGVPIVMNDCIAFLECKVVQTMDVGTHIMFIGDLVQSDIIDDKAEPLTYDYYRKVKKGVAPQNSPTYIDKSKLGLTEKNAISKQYKCSVCGYIYDESNENIKFAELDEEWVCPICGADKHEFNEI